MFGFLRNRAVCLNSDTAVLKVFGLSPELSRPHNSPTLFKSFFTPNLAETVASDLIAKLLARPRLRHGIRRRRPNRAIVPKLDKLAMTSYCATLQTRHHINNKITNQGTLSKFSRGECDKGLATHPSFLQQD